MLFHHDWIFFAIFFPFSQHLSFISSVPSSSICSANQLILYILLYTCPLWFVSFPLKMVLLGWKACLMLSLSVCSTVYLFVCLYILLSFLFMSSCFIWASYICLSLGCSVCLSFSDCVFCQVQVLCCWAITCMLPVMISQLKWYIVTLIWLICDIWIISLFMSFFLINRVVLARFGDTAWQAGHIFKHWILF